MKKYLLVALLIFAACRPGPNEPRLACEENNDGLTVPAGFCAIVVADSLGRARHLTVRENGDVYVALRQPTDEGGIVALRDMDGDGRADTIAYFGDLGGTGIHLHDEWLYFGADTLIMRYAMQENALLPDGNVQIIVEGFHNQATHAVKPFEFDQSGGMYVNIGVPSNACQAQSRIPEVEGLDPCPLS